MLPGTTVKVAMMVRDSPGPRLPRAHGNGVVQSPAFDRKTSPGGVGSVTDTSFAIEGPAFVTTRV